VQYGKGEVFECVMVELMGSVLFALQLLLQQYLKRDGKRFEEGLELWYSEFEVVGVDREAAKYSFHRLLLFIKEKLNLVEV
jgi:hypothetical protein